MNENQIIALSAEEIEAVDGGEGTAWWNVWGHAVNTLEAAYDFGKKVGNDIGNLVYN
jgi:hypothetical protein